MTSIPDSPTIKRCRAPRGAGAPVRLIGLITAIALVAAGCGGTDTESFSDPVDDFLVTTTAPAPESQLIDDIVTALAAQTRIPRPDAQLRCVAEAAVDAVGADQLIAAGAPAAGTFDGTLLDGPSQEALIDEVIACVEIGSLLMDSDVLGTAVSSESVSCLVEEIETNGLAETLIRALVATGPDQALATNVVPIVETLAACLTLAEVASVVEAFGLVSLLPGG